MTDEWWNCIMTLATAIRTLERDVVDLHRGYPDYWCRRRRMRRAVERLRRLRRELIQMAEDGLL